MSRIEKATSRYKSTGEKDFYLDLWESIDLGSSVNDTLTRLDAKYHRRPDKLSYDLYGTPRLWWVFAVINPNELKDPVNDFVSGLEILVPSKERVESDIL